VNTLRTIVIFAVLGAVGYGVYATLNRRPPVDPPEPIPESWVESPAVQLAEETTAPPGGPSMGMPGGALPAISAPGGFAPTASDEAPPFTAPPHGAIPTTEAPSFSAPSSGASQTSEAPSYTATEPATITPPSTAATMTPPEMSSSFGAAPIAPPTMNVDSAHAPSAPSSVEQRPDLSDAPPYGDPSTQNTTPSAAPHVPPPPPAQPTGHVEAPWYGPQQPAATSAAVPPPEGTTPAAEFAASWQAVGQLLSQDRLVEAHRELSRWYADPRIAASQQQVQELLDQLAGTIIYSRESLMDPAYEVQPGDTLERIAGRYQVPWQLLAKINGIGDPNSLRSGERLKVVRGPFSADVDVSRFRLTLWLGDLYAGSFPIGLGGDHSLADGVFAVEQKVQNPTYYGPEGVIAADDPANPLGERLLSLGQQLGIHGTNEPQGLGQAGSRGCIRLSARDIDDVYDILSVGSRVTIRR
jgi:hypothetical protein